MDQHLGRWKGANGMVNSISRRAYGAEQHLAPRRAAGDTSRAPFGPFCTCAMDATMEIQLQSVQGERICVCQNERPQNNSEKCHYSYCFCCHEHKSILLCELMLLEAVFCQNRIEFSSMRRPVHLSLVEFGVRTFPREPKLAQVASIHCAHLSPDSSITGPNSCTMTKRCALASAVELSFTLTQTEPI